MVLEVVYRTEFIFCPEDQVGWTIVGPRATQGCYIEGGGFDHYIVEEVGLYSDGRTGNYPESNSESHLD